MSKSASIELESSVVPLRWIGEQRDGYLEMIDQRRLPDEEVWLVLDDLEDVCEGISEMVVRGAPAIGIAAAYGIAIAVRNAVRDEGVEEGDELVEVLAEAGGQLMETRPTAVNLRWAIERMREVGRDERHRHGWEFVDRMFREAETIYDEDRENNERMAQNGAELLPLDAEVLTHCNTGGLATGGFGTALGVIRAASESGRLEHVWIDETRPYLQGARLTTWECLEDDVPATLITDNMAAHFMKEGRVDAVVVGTDRVVANGDVANKIGTYGLAVLCDVHEIPFYVAAPVSTIDLETPSGEEIPIEERSREEVTRVGETRIAPEEIDVAHPAFDVTPAEYVDAIITEYGVVRPPYERSLREIVEKAQTARAEHAADSSMETI